MYLKAFLLVLGILIASANCLECLGNTGIVLVSDADNTFTSKVTFDDQGWIESFYWDSTKDGSLNLTGTNGTSVQVSGNGCQIGGGSYFGFLDAEWWHGSDPWVDSTDLPYFYMSTIQDTTECTISFDPPLRSFVAYTNSFYEASGTCSFFIYDVSNNQFDCSNDCPINAGANNYKLRGLVGNKPIHKILWTNTYTAVDNIKYELWCPDNNYVNDGINEYCDYCSSKPCSSLATCENTGRSFSCTCPDGYMGDGKGPDGCQVIPPQAAPIASDPPVAEPVSNQPTNEPINEPTSTTPAAPKSTPAAMTSGASQMIVSLATLVAVTLL